MNKKCDEYLSLVEDALYDYFGEKRDEYKILFDSMEYSVRNGGKRVRPLLAMLFCRASGGNVKDALPFAAAVEYIHTYSLIHDDLPCMDDDDFRRGKPSNHKVFGESYALLAGDGLLTAAFEVISKAALDGIISSEKAIEGIRCLSARAGSRGMIGGQVIDLLSENKNIGADELKFLDSLKTGALIEAACVLGCIAAEADSEKTEAAKRFACSIGLAFQIQDDILDVTGSAEKLGKPIGSDSANGKSTYVNALGLEACRKLVETLTDEALTALDVFEDPDDLRDYARFLAGRDH